MCASMMVQNFSATQSRDKPEFLAKLQSFCCDSCADAT
ncbi:hypothetical protein CEV31_0406 [Brucella thiophenivorans]|uniref:Uncharacterized protein n=1 Tax=Brucella thiophenivorans TaxID=571255 RepID=A0A256G4L1_9HYPH|nr:hypothetical protein CEV31_0406 [Brucella thiophenivorans]